MPRCATCCSTTSSGTARWWSRIGSKDPSSRSCVSSTAGASIDGAGAGSQAGLRRRRRAQYGRHGCLLAAAVRDRGGRTVCVGADHAARRRCDVRRRVSLHGGALRRPDEDARRHQGDRVQRPFRRSGDGSSATAPEKRHRGDLLGRGRRLGSWSTRSNGTTFRRWAWCWPRRAIPATMRRAS